MSKIFYHHHHYHNPLDFSDRSGYPNAEAILKFLHNSLSTVVISNSRIVIFVHCFKFSYLFLRWHILCPATTVPCMMVLHRLPCLLTCPTHTIFSVWQKRFLVALKILNPILHKFIVFMFPTEDVKGFSHVFVLKRLDHSLCFWQRFPRSTSIWQNGDYQRFV